MKTKRNFSTTALLAAAAMTLLGVTTSRAADGTPVWTNLFNGAANSEDVAHALAMDASGNVVVTGHSFGSGGTVDYATIKYSGAGVPLWTNIYNGAANNTDIARALAVDGSGNVLVTGDSLGSSNYDYATIKYSSAGVPIWTNRFNGAANRDDGAEALAVDGNGNVLVTGYSTASNGYSDYATIKYSSAGVPLWTNRFNGTANRDDHARALAVDGSGNVVVTGYSTAANGSYDYPTIKYSSAGLPLWTNLSSRTVNGIAQAQSLAVDGSGNVYVTGSSEAANGFDDYAAIKYSSAGLPLWTNLFNGAANSSDEASALVVDGSGNVVVTGYSTATNGYYDYATIKYSGAGVPLWTNLFNGEANRSDYARALAVDGSGNVYVTGGSSGIGSALDYATIKYSSAGVPLWTNLFNGAANNTDQTSALAVDGSGNIFVTGSSTAANGGRDYVTIKYSGGNPSPTITAVLVSGGDMLLSSVGLAGTNYALDRTFNLLPPINWMPQQTNPAGAGGLLFFTNTPNPATNNFWRVRSVP